MGASNYVQPYVYLKQLQ